jgi:Tfp pilus assembly protein PilZ
LVGEKQPSVLVAGVGRASFEALAPVLDRQNLDITQVTSVENAIRLSHADRVDLVILDAKPKTMGLEAAVTAFRAKKSVSRNASLVVLAKPESVDEARELIGHGVNRVMLAGDPPNIVARLVADLLDIAPRTTLRMATRLLVEVADGADEALGAVVNISATGLLVETDADFETGQHVIMTIEVPGEDELLALKAEVVRRADPARDGVEGIGVHFLGFAGDGRARLDAILEAELGPGGGTPDYT